MKGKISAFFLMVFGMLVIFSLSAISSQDQQNFRFRIGRLILDFADNGSANVNIDDYGLGYVLFNEYSRGNSGQISFFLPFGQGKGMFSIGAFVDGWEASEGFASIDAFMTTIFRFVFNAPKIIPPDTSLPNSVGFILFLEGWANAWGHGPLPSDYPGYASASGNFTTELISASAYINAFFPNPPYLPFDVYDYDPEQGYRRDATIKTVDITSGQGEYVVKFSGSAATMNFNAMSVGTAYARTGIVVLSGVDPLGIPEIGDNEFVYQETAWREPIDGGVWHHYVRLFIPARARIVCGFTPDRDLLEWLKGSLDWYIQPQIATDHYYDERLENGYNEFEIFPIFREGESALYPTRVEGLLFTDVYLPENIDDFGKKRIILTFNDQDVHAANIEIFFPATGTLHPPGGPEGCFLIGPIHLGSVTTPNWMYYYWQIYPNQQIKYTNSNYSFYYEGQDHVHIGNDVIYGHADGIDGLGRRWETYIPEPPYSNVSPIFAYQVYSIDAYVRAVAHELEHKRIYDEYHALIEQASQNGITLDDPNDDYDGDGLPNFVEWQVGTDPERRYTLGTDWFDDNELLANLAEHNVFGDKNKDWSDQGLNKGVPRQRVLIRQVR